MRNSTTWNEIKGTWQHGKTQTIRVPVALAPKILKLGRLLDTGLDPTEYRIIEFLLIKSRQYQRSKTPLNRFTPRWSVFNEFENWLKIHQ